MELIDKVYEYMAILNKTNNKHNYRHDMIDQRQEYVDKNTRVNNDSEERRKSMLYR